MTTEVKTEDAPLRLNLGGGDVEIEGFVNVDRKVGKEVYPLAYDEDAVDEIRASHILEHFAFGEVLAVVKQWVSRLKPGGLMRIAVPDFKWIAEHYLKRDPINTQGYVMGGQTDANDFHRAVFDRELLKELMISAGLERIGHWQTEAQDAARLPVSLNLQGFKPSAGESVTRNVRAILSCPRFGTTMHTRCTHNALARAAIPYGLMQGAYWGQVLSELMEESLAFVDRDGNRVEFIITVDYDSIFSYDDVLELCRLIRADTTADAICPVQTRRGGEWVLMGISDAEGKVRTRIYAEEFNQHLSPLLRGHFGLTIFRAESLRSQPRPWMVPEPGPDGRWDKGCVDMDIDFWRRWKAEGKTLYLANRVPIGHLEEVISWPTTDMKPIYQTLMSYTEKGIPSEVQR